MRGGWGKMRKKQFWFSILVTTLVLAFSLVSSVSAAAQSPVAPGTTGKFPLQPGYVLPVNTEDEPDLANLVEVVNVARPAVVAIELQIVSTNIFNQPVEQQGAGSGWIFDSSGLIATNHHVIEGADTITVILSDGRTFNAEAVVSDPVTDVAVIKVNATGLPTATIGSTDQVEVGEMVAAMGNALGRGISVTGGWISRKNVTFDLDQGQFMYDLLETDAAVNPGNSGGPLLNLEGEVIGMTNAKLASAQIEGVAFAISSQTFVPVIEDLVSQGTVRRPYLGVSLQTLTPDIANLLGLSVSQGVLIASVVPGGPAASAGLQMGDVIVSIGGQEVTEISEAIRIIRESNIGDTISITYVRDGMEQTVNVTLAQAS